MLSIGMPVRVMTAIYWGLPIKKTVRSVELPQIIPFLTNLKQQIILIRTKSPTQATESDQNIKTFMVYGFTTVNQNKNP